MKILLVEDNAMDAKMLTRSLRSEGVTFEFVRVDNEEDYLIELGNEYDIIISDYMMPLFTGMDALKIRNQKCPYIPFIIVTASVNERVAVECIQSGADDYIIKEHITRLAAAISRAIEFKKVEKENAEAREKLERSEKRFRQLVEDLPDALYITTIGPETSGIIVDVNPGVELQTGYSRDELIGMNIFEKLIEDEVPLGKTKERNEKLLSGERLLFNEKKRRKDGTIFWTQVKATTIEIDGKKYILAVNRDITEQIKTHLALEKSESDLKRAQSVAHIGSWTSDLVNDITTWSEELYKILEHNSRIPMNYHEFNEAIHPEDREWVEQAWKKAHKTGVYDVEFRILVNGKMKWVHDLAEFERNEKGKVTFAVGTIQDITNEKIAREAVKKSEQRFRDLVEKTQVGMMITDEKGNIIYFNDRLKELFGYDQFEFSRLKMADIIYPDDLNFVNEQHRKRFAGKETESRYEFRGLRKDGQLIWLEIAVETIIEDGAVVGTRSYIWDISDRKKQEEELRESEEKFRKAFLTSPDSVNINRLSDGMYISINKGFTDITGFTEEDVHGKTSLDIEIWADPEDRQKLVAGLRKDGIVRNLEARFKMKDGTISYGLMSAVVIQLHGEPHIISITRDITERKKMEEELRESEESFRGLFNNVEEEIYVQDSEGRFIEVNEGAIKAYGYEHDYFIGKTPAVLAAPDRNNMEEIYQSIKKAFDGENQTVQFWGKNIKGEIHPKEVRLYNGTYFGQKVVIAMANDITERIEYQQNIERFQMELIHLNTRLNSAREEEQAKISGELHDQLGQYLTAIRIDSVSTLKNVPDNLPEVKKKLGGIVELVDGAIQSTKDISAKLRPAMLDELGLDSALDWEAKRFGARTGLSVKLDYLVGESNPPKEISTAIYRIFMEATTNISRHAKAKNVYCTITFEDNSYEMLIEDDGIGIDTNDIFNQASLGIFGMKQRIKNLNGNLEIGNREPKGTFVKISIPADQ